MSQLNTKTLGFTLVELSIVIIIIGFLIAGISAGNSMIKSAELNSVITDFRNYQAAYNNFIGRYGSPPGDLQNASSIWDNNTCALTNSDCNGNGNGLIDNSKYEVYSAWKHLELAGMVNARVALIGASNHPTVGVNMPPSKITGAGYTLISGAKVNTDLSGNGWLWSGNNGLSPINVNIILIAKADTNPFPGNLSGQGALHESVLSITQTYSIDVKADDGDPENGQFRAGDGNNTLTECVTNNPVKYVESTGEKAVCYIAMALN